MEANRERGADSPEASQRADEIARTVEAVEAGNLAEGITIPRAEPRRLSDEELGGRAALEAAGLEPVDGWDDERADLTPEQDAALGSGAACVATCEVCERPLEGLPGDSFTCHHDCRIKVIEAMETMGGGFVSRLAMAWMRADDDNHERLRSAFPEYWEQYAELARRDREKAVRP